VRGSVCAGEPHDSACPNVKFRSLTMMIFSLSINDEVIILSLEPTRFCEDPYIFIKESRVSSLIDVMCAPNTPSQPQIFSILIVLLLKPKGHPAIDL